jgi:hypothetical protein
MICWIVEFKKVLNSFLYLSIACGSLKGYVSGEGKLGFCLHGENWIK